MKVKFGELLYEDGVITKQQLQDALVMQTDNPNVPIGEILLSQGAITRDHIIAYIEKLIFVTGEIPSVAVEMLDQDEIDRIFDAYKLKLSQQENS